MGKKLLPLALLLALAPLGTAQRAPVRPAPQAPLPTRGILGEPLPKGTHLQAVLGGRGSTLVGPAVSVTAVLAPGVYQLTFDDPGTGWQERVLLGVPSAPLLPAPLLVAYHGYGHSEQDILVNTSLFQQGLDRGWFVLAPLGAHPFNFGVPYAQANVAHVLDWLLAVAQIDRFRIYGVGFSMGGGWALSQAARHLDPMRAMFAAVVNHTGTVSTSHVWWNSQDRSLLEHPDLFGGPPSAVPFAYQRVSTVDLAPFTKEVDPLSDMARNLAHVVTRTWNATHDPLAYLVEQSQALFAWLSGAGHATALIQVPSNQHTWATLDATAALDDLEQHVLSIPTSGTRRLMADRNGRYLFFDVQQAAAGALSPWTYHLDPANNRVIVAESRNLQKLGLRVGDAGLSTAQALTVVIGPSDAFQQIVLRGYLAAPQNVLRGGVATDQWIHDPVAKTLTLFEGTGLGWPTWRVEP